MYFREEGWRERRGELKVRSNTLMDERLKNKGNFNKRNHAEVCRLNRSRVALVHTTDTRCREAF